MRGSDTGKPTATERYLLRNPLPTDLASIEARAIAYYQSILGKQLEGGFASRLAVALIQYGDVRVYFDSKDGEFKIEQCRDGRKRAAEPHQPQLSTERGQLIGGNGRQSSGDEWCRNCLEWIGNCRCEG